MTSIVLLWDLNQSPAPASMFDFNLDSRHEPGGGAPPPLFSEKSLKLTMKNWNLKKIFEIDHEIQ